MSADQPQLPFTAKSKSPKTAPPPKQRNVDRRTREHLTPSEVERLLKAARQSGRYAFRNYLLILIAYRHALRSGEVVDLEWSQIDFATGKIHINRLKKGTESTHFLEGDEIRYLRKLQRLYPDSPYIFCSERKSPLSTRSVRAIVAEAGERAQLGFPIHPHMLRHAKGYQLASKGTDTRAIQGYMGHKNIHHTVHYTQLNPDRFRGFGKD